MPRNDIKIPSFTVFRDEVFSKISKREKNTLFYWSLFDESSREEALKEFLPPHYLESGKAKVLRILQKRRSFYKKYIAYKKDKFHEKFVYNEFLPNYLVVAELENKIRSFHWKIKTSGPRNLNFPDITIDNTKIGEIIIELKNLISGASLTEKILPNVERNIEKAQRENGDKNKYNNLLLILLFPFCYREYRRYARRINQLVEGFYFCQKILSKYTKNKARVLTQCVAQNGDKKYCLNELINRILEDLQKRVE